MEHLKRVYAAARKGNYDIYVVFIEKALQLLGKGGQLGFILPHKFFNAQYGEEARALLSEGRHLREVVHFGHAQIFENATTYTCLLFAGKSPAEKVAITRVSDVDEWRTGGQAVTGQVDAASLSREAWNFTVGEGSALFDKLAAMPVKLGDVAERISQGIRTSANEVYLLDFVSEKGKLIKAFSQHLGEEVTLERDSVSLFLRGREIKPYRVLPSGKVVIMPYTLDDEGRATFIGEAAMRSSFPNTFAYLLKNKDRSYAFGLSLQCVCERANRIASRTKDNLAAYQLTPLCKR